MHVLCPFGPKAKPNLLLLMPGRRSVQKSPPRLVFKIVLWLVSCLDWLIDQLVPAPNRLLERSLAFMDSQTIFACSELGIADHISHKEEVSSVDLAKRSDLPEEALFRLVKAASHTGVFKVKRKGSVHLISHTKLSLVLRDDHYSGLKYMLSHQAHEVQGAMTKLTHSVRTAHIPGSPSGFQVYLSEKSQEIGQPTGHGKSPPGFWEYLDSHPERLKNFSQAMRASDSIGSNVVIEDYNWSAFERIVDIGGATGSFVKALMAADKQVKKGIICDLPQVIEDARCIAKAEEASKDSLKSSLIPRLEFKAINFFETESGIPSAQDGDCYLMRVILHDWDDTSCRTILKNVRKAMGSAKVKLVLVETLPSGLQRNPLLKAKRMLDLTMMTVVKGKERDATDFNLLFKECGFKADGIKETCSIFSVLTATPI